MATRFYLPYTGAAAVSPTFGAGWGVTTNAIRRAIVTTRISSAVTAVNGVANAATGNQLLYQGVSAPLAAQTLTGSFKGQVFGVATGGAPGALAVRVAKCAGDGSGVTEIKAVTYSASTGTAAPPDYNTTAQNRRMEEGVDDFVLDFTNVSISDGDRLIVEIGYVDNTANVTRAVNLYFGDDSGTDLPEDETTTTATYNPWIEFTADISFQTAGQTATLTDTLSVADDSLAYRTAFRHAESTLTLADQLALTRSLTRILEDALVVSEGDLLTSTIYEVIAEDAMTLSDALLKNLRIVRFLSDDTTLVDELVSSITGQQNVIQATLTSELALVDQVVRTVEMVRFLSDTLDLLDATLAATLRDAVLSDTVTVVDAVILTNRIARLLESGVALDDAVRLSLLLTRTLADALTLGDNASTSITQYFATYATRQARIGMLADPVKLGIAQDTVQLGVAA